MLGGMERRVMLRMDISNLRLAELRSLLATARKRGQDALAQQIEAEIASRGRSQPAKPAPLVLEADEVLPIDLEPVDLEPGEPEFEHQSAEMDPGPAFEPEDVGPIGFGPAPDDFAFQSPRRAKRRPTRRWPMGLAVAGLLTAGAAMTWGLNGAPALLRDQNQPAPSVVAAAPSPAPRAMTVRTETPAPPPTPAADEPEPPPVVAKAEPARERPSRLDPCAAPPSPAERLLCNDLALNLLDHEMREAYGRAMDAGADPVALRESQAAWRRARDPTADPRALASLYDSRIRELKAAAEPPPP
jgi:uncharacterized protein YecT (DUF1311 family)